MTRTPNLVAAVLAGLLCAACPAAELLCPRAAEPPEIDGRLDDAAWTKALRLADFTRPSSKQPPAKPVDVRLCFDSRALYVAFVCAEPEPKRIRARATVENDDVWKDDCVEVWVRSTDAALECDQFIVNTLGTRQSVRRRQRRDAAAWKPTWRPAARVEAKRWVVEMRIPFTDLEMAAPKPGDMI